MYIFSPFILLVRQVETEDKNRYHQLLTKNKKEAWQNDRVGSDQVNQVMGQMGHGLKTSHFKWVKTGSGCRFQVGLGRVDPYFHFFFYIYKKKKNNMYLPFGKLCNKLFDVKCIILNSLLISRINSIKFISTYSIILKLYNS